MHVFGAKSSAHSVPLKQAASPDKSSKHGAPIAVLLYTGVVKQPPVKSDASVNAVAEHVKVCAWHVEAGAPGGSAPSQSVLSRHETLPITVDGHCSVGAAMHVHGNASSCDAALVLHAPVAGSTKPVTHVSLAPSPAPSTSTTPMHGQLSTYTVVL
jgi:hypothetical protein